MVGSKAKAPQKVIM